MNHTDDTLKQLFNELVDAELGPPRPAPALARLSQITVAPSDSGQPVPSARTGHRLAAWRTPLLAAAVVAVAAAGSILAIGAQRGSHPAPAGSSPSASPITTSAAPTPAVPTLRYYNSLLEASELAGVLVGPVSAADSKFKPGLVETLPGLPQILQPGKSYTGGMEYVAVTQTDPWNYLAVTITDVASENCPPPFKIHPGHSYQVSCSFVPKAGHTGRLRLTVYSEGGSEGGSVELLTP